MFKITNEGVFIEKYLPGREYTVLVTENEKTGIEVFPVLERVFHSKLQSHERLLTFETYLAGYEWKGHTIPGKPFDHFVPVISQEQIQIVARNAYTALNGNGYLSNFPHN